MSSKTATKAAPSKRLSAHWTWHDQPPRLEHDSGFRAVLYERGVCVALDARREGHGYLAHAEVKMPKEDVEELAGLLERWLAKECPAAWKARRGEKKGAKAA